MFQTAPVRVSQSSSLGKAGFLRLFCACPPQEQHPSFAEKGGEEEGRREELEWKLFHRRRRANNNNNNSGATFLDGKILSCSSPRKRKNTRGREGKVPNTSGHGKQEGTNWRETKHVSFPHFRFKPPSVTFRRHKKRFVISLTRSGEKKQGFPAFSFLPDPVFPPVSQLLFPPSAFRSSPPSISLVLKRLPPFPPTPPFPFPPSFFLRRKKPPFALIFSAPKKRYPTPYIRRPPPGLNASGRKTVVCLSTCTNE